MDETYGYTTIAFSYHDWLFETNHSHQTINLDNVGGTENVFCLPWNITKLVYVVGVQKRAGF